MKRLLLILTIALAFSVTAVPRLSAQSAMFVYTGVPAAPLNPGDIFTVRVSLTVVTLNVIDGLSYWFAQSSAGAPAFQLNSRVTGPYNPPSVTFTLLVLPGLVVPQVMDPINRNPNGTTTSTDLGALSIHQTPPSGTYFIADLTFQVLASAAPGTYTLGNTTNTTPGVGDRISVWYDGLGNSAPIAASPFNITVVPEPGSLALLCVGLVSAGALAYRRRRGSSLP